MPQQRSKTPRTCETCGAAFFPFPDSTGRYCSRSCAAQSRKPRPVEDRLWARVDKTGPIPAHRPDLGPCWLWTGYREQHGYGQMRTTDRSELTHRVAWRLTNGPIPSETPYVLHRCDNPPCCNPAHLFLGDQDANMADAKEKGRVRSGDDHGLRRHPERAAWGDRNGSRTRPASVPRGERHYKAKLTAETVRSIRTRAAAGATQTALAVEHGLSVVTVHKVVHRLTWKHVE